MKKIILSLLVVFMSLPAMAADETITISGTVYDNTYEKYQPTDYAEIFYKDSSDNAQGTVTDKDGKFTLQNVPSNATVTISYVGCTDQQYTASSIPSTIKLDCNTTLDEVVTTGENLTGKPCRDEYIKGLNAESGKYVKNDNGRLFCDIKCRKNYTKTDGTYEITYIDPNTNEPITNTQPYKCICSGDFVEIGTECLPVSGCSKDPGVHESKYEKSGDTYECVVKSCECGYTLNNGKCEKWDTSTCTTMPENASKIERTCKNGAEYCEIKQCECGYTLKDNQCQKMADDTCTKKPAHATKISHACNDGVETCIVTECEDGWKPDPETNATACIKKLKECTPEQKEQLTKEHATKTGIKAGTETCIALACKCGYDLVGEKCVAWAENTPCATDKLPADAKSGIRACNERGKEYCKITACTNDTEYTHNKEKNRCEYLKGETCTHTDTNAERAEWKNVDGKLVCTLKKCKDGFYVVDNKCEPSDGDCTAEQLKQIEHAIKGARKKDKCTPTECEPGFEPSGNECVEIAGKCETKPEHSKKSHREFVSGAEICKIDECEDGYRISSDGQKCEPSLDEKQARDKAKELRANADEMKRIEQSTENKLLGAAGMGAAGIGGMQVASALAEKNADEDAERDMAAYLATFRCDYGHGLNIKGGETGIELPGANSLIPLYQEYVNLANDLKVRKNALGMKPGIESEKILDAATSGLYDNQSIGKVDGAFTSLARALADPTGADAAEWAAQKDATAKKLKTGAIVAGVGILGSAVGNAIINRNVNEKSDEIIRNYQPLKNLEEKINQIPEQKTSCPTDATGTYVPDCTCKDKSKFYNDNTNTCDACTNSGEIVKDNQCQCAIAGQIVDGDACKCPGNQIVNGDKCACPSDKQQWDGATQTCVAKKPEPKTCEYKCAEPTPKNHLVRNNDAKCTCGCNNGYTYNETSHTCECVGENMKEENSQCTKVVVKTETKVEEVLQLVQNTTTTITLDAGSLFDIGKSTLRPEAKVELNNFLNNDMAGKSECELTIIGYTDPVGSIQTNQKLSMDRATSVKNYLQSNDTNKLLKSVTAQGFGENSCFCGVGKGKIPSGQEKTRDYVACYGREETYPITGDQRFAPCRRVEIQAKCIAKTSESSTEAVKKN